MESKRHGNPKMNDSNSNPVAKLASLKNSLIPQQAMATRSFTIGKADKQNHLSFTSPIQAKVKGKIPTEPRKARTVWTKQEDEMLYRIVTSTPSTPVLAMEASEGKWPTVAKLMNTGRTAKQCRDRYTNNLRQDVKKGEWTTDEINLIMDMYETFGAKWNTMAMILKDRSDNDIKNKWYSMQRQQKRADAKFQAARVRLQQGDVVIVDGVYMKQYAPALQTSTSTHEYDQLPAAMTSLLSVPPKHLTANDSTSAPHDAPTNDEKNCR